MIILIFFIYINWFWWQTIKNWKYVSKCRHYCLLFAKDNIAAISWQVLGPLSVLAEFAWPLRTPEKEFSGFSWEELNHKWNIDTRPAPWLLPEHKKFQQSFFWPELSLFFSHTWGCYFSIFGIRQIAHFYWQVGTNGPQNVREKTFEADRFMAWQCSQVFK